MKRQRAQLAEIRNDDDYTRDTSKANVEMLHGNKKTLEKMIA